MIRSALLASAVAMTLLVAPPAHALLGAGDIVFDPTNYAEAIKSLTQLEQQYQKITQVYGALAHPTSMGQVAGALNSAGVQNPLGQFGNIQGVINGVTSGNMSGTIQGLQQANQYFAPTGTDFAAQQMTRNATGTAGIQAMVLANLQSLQERTAGLQDLRASLDSGDITDMAALSNRFHSEQQFLAVQQAQATNLQTLLMTQSRTEDQRVSEKQRQDAEALINCTQAAATALNVSSFGANTGQAGAVMASTATAPSVPVFGGN